MSSRATASLIAAAVLLSVGFTVATLFGAQGRRVLLFIDFRAFYCAGTAVASGRDPYRSEPLATCEQTSAAAPFRRRGFIVPAPLPPAALGCFSLLARLPFLAAATLWAMLLGANFFFLTWACNRLSGVRAIYCFALLLPLGLVCPLQLGQLAPFAVSFGIAAALALRSGRAELGGLLAVGTLMEPQLGIPICATLAVCFSSARTALAFGAVIFVALGIAALGWNANVEYVTSVLPAHARAELAYDDQYSFAYIVRWLGASPNASLAAGYASYWIVCAAAVIYCAILSRGGRRADIVPFAMAAPVAAGPYLHVEHFVAMVPLALCVLATASGILRWVCAIASVLVAWPVKWCAQMLGLIAPPTMYPVPTATNGALADDMWAATIATQSSHAVFFLAKIPTWLGAWFTLASFAILAWQQRDQSDPFAEKRYSSIGS